jgi:hypothetical protein
MVLPVLGLGLTGPFICFAVIGLAALALLRLRLPNDEPQFAARAGPAPYSSGSGAPSDPPDSADSAESAATEGDPAAEPPRLSWRDPRLRPWIIAGFFGGHAQAMVLGVSGFLVLDRLGLRDTPAEGAGPVGVVLMSGAIATLLAQWGLIPRFDLGPRAATLWGIATAAFGTLVLGLAGSLHTIALGYAIASLGFGLFRPGTTAGTSLAVTRAEQGQASGIVASLAGASYIYAPALGVGLYGVSDGLGFGLMITLCLIVLILGWRGLQADDMLTTEAR